MAARKTKTKKNVPTKADLAALVTDFQRGNKDLLKALELFQISNEEYERAMRALTGSSAVTASSSDGSHAILLE